MTLLVFSIEESGKALKLFGSMQMKKAVSPKHIRSHKRKVETYATCDMLRDIISPIHEGILPKILETVEKYDMEDIQPMADELHAYHSEQFRRRLDELLSVKDGVMFKEFEDKLDYYCG